MVSGSPSSVHTLRPVVEASAASLALGEGVTIPRRSFDQEPDRRGDGDEQIEVFRVVGLFGPPRPEHQQRERHGAGLRRGNRDEQLDAVLDEQPPLVAGELMPHPCRVAERERERLAQHGQHANDRQRRRQRPDRVPSQTPAATAAKVRSPGTYLRTSTNCGCSASSICWVTDGAIASKLEAWLI